MNITCTICGKNISDSAGFLGITKGEASDCHKWLHLSMAASESLIYLDDLLSGDQRRIEHAISEKEKLESIVSRLKKTLGIEDGLFKCE